MRPSQHAMLGRVALAALSLMVSVALIEGIFRALAFDFDRRAQRLERIPIFVRRPDVPLAGAYFRRPGPAHWEGQVLTPVFRGMGVPEAFLGDEPEVSISYDRDGFRNPPDLEDWEVVVVGDSFTELGYLEYEDLFTTHVARRLGIRVKNLGVSQTGPFTHVAYLSEYGKAASTRHAVLAFYEGNDVDNAFAEHRRLRQLEWQGPGGPTARPIADPVPPQSSFVVALARSLSSIATKPQAPKPVYPSTVFVVGDERVAIMLGPLPPSAAALGRRAMALEQALRAWADVSRALGLEPWLLYVPAKVRILEGHLEVAGDSRKHAWRPTDLPEHVRALVEPMGIRFVDPIPALRVEAAHGRLPYNRIDTHLDRRGAEVIGRVLADALRAGGVEARPAKLEVPPES